MRAGRSLSEVIIDLLARAAAAPFALILTHWVFKMPTTIYPKDIQGWTFPWRNLALRHQAERRMHRYPHDAEREHFKARLRDWGRRPRRKTFGPAFAAWMAGEWRLAMELAQVSTFVRNQFDALMSKRAA